MKNKKSLRGAVVFYIDVGNLPPNKANEFVKQMCENNQEFLDSMPEDIGKVYLPVRNSATRVEFLQFPN